MLSNRPLRPLALLALLVPLAPAQEGSVDLDSLLASARGAASENSLRPTIQVSGTTTKNGLPARFRWTLAPEGFFLRELQGRFPQRSGYDGRVAWHVEGRAPAYELALLDRERLLTSSWLLSGVWCLEDSPFSIDLEKAPDAQTHRLRLRLREGLLRATLLVDATTHLPRELAFDEDFGGGQLRFQEWSAEGSPRLPGRIVDEPAQGEPILFEVQSAGPWTRPGPSYQRPAVEKGDTTFDAQAPSAVEVRRVESGHLFVRPKIDGRALGWFLFDSGLGGSVLTRSAAEELGLGSFGETFVGGFGGAPERSVFRQGQQLELGPLTIEFPVFIEQASMGRAERMLAGETCAGALGWDVFLRAVVEVDPEAGELSLHDPRAFEAPAARWHELALHWKIPYLRARFEGQREGWFGLDTGAGKLTALFHYSAAARLGLLEGGDDSSIPSQGARGSFERRPHELEWFEVAGRRHAPAVVQLSIAEDGEADPYSCGFLGGGFFAGERLFFDYSRARVGFAPAD